MNDYLFRIPNHYLLCYLKQSIFFFFMVLCGSTTASAADIKDFNSSIPADRTATDHYDKRITSKYQTHLSRDAEVLNEFVQRVEKKWGKGNALVPVPKVWVQYEDSMDVRGSVDFENGIARVQMLVEDATDTGIDRQLTDAMEDLFLGKGEMPVEMMQRLMSQEEKETTTSTTIPKSAFDTRTKHYTVSKGDTLWGLSKRFNVKRSDIAHLNNIDPDGWLMIGQRLLIPGQEADNTVAQKKTDLANASAERPSAPLLHGMIRDTDGMTVTRDNVASFAKKLVATQRLKRVSIHGTDGTNRQAVSISFRLIPDHMRVRAERYRQFIRRYSKKFGIYAPLIYAVIHTESAFNPMARSGAPAYGLMQLVPGSGARDAYLMVYEMDKYLDPEYLYDPGNNIELGTAYLQILDGRYLRHIENQTSRMYCSIAAYNTGAGNVSRAFRDDTSIRQAASIINKLNPEEVYERLRSNLPYEETRNYIKRVCDRIPLYEE